MRHHEAIGQRRQVGVGPQRGPGRGSWVTRTTPALRFSAVVVRPPLIPVAPIAHAPIVTGLRRSRFLLLTRAQSQSSSGHPFLLSPPASAGLLELILCVLSSFTAPAPLGSLLLGTGGGRRLTFIFCSSTPLPPAGDGAIVSRRVIAWFSKLLAAGDGAPSTRPGSRPVA